jgi:hypothetical protein
MSPGEFLRCALLERPVRATLVLRPPPDLDALWGFTEGLEPVRIEALPSQRRMEGFPMGIVRRRPRSREVDAHRVLIRPQSHDLTAELAAVIAQEPSRGTPLSREPSEPIHDGLTAEALTALNGDPVPREHVHHRQGAKSVPMDQLIGHKVQTPGIIRSCHRGPMGSDDHGFSPPGGGR